MNATLSLRALSFPRKKVVQISLTSFTTHSNVCVESKTRQALSFFAVNRLPRTISGAELLGVKLHNA